MNYSFKKGLGKSIASMIIFALPLVLLNQPEWANLTIGGALALLVNFLKVKTSK